MGDSVQGVLSTQRAQRARTREALRGVVGGLCVAILGFHATLAAIAGIATLAWSGSAFVIAGESMEPSLKRGAVVIDRPVTTSGLEEGDIVTFRSASQVVTHRVLTVTPEGITTQGDNNQMADSTVVTNAELLGQTGLVVPHLGWPRLWLVEGRYLPLAAWLFMIVACTAGAIQFREGGEVADDHELTA